MIELKNINKTYYTDTGVTFRALSNISTTFDDTGLVFVLGKSGSGKSTLLNILGALDNYDSGEMWVGDKLTKNMSGNMLDYYRNTMIGFVFQEFNLIDSLTVMENVRFALDIKNDKSLKVTRKERVLEILDKMGIKDKANAKTYNLSGGQRQRVAIARAIIKEPDIILADEPTGSLDSVTGQEIIDILSEISKTKLVIVVTHDVLTAAKYGDRIIEMKDGKVYRDVRRRKPGESLMTCGVDIVSNTLIRLNRDANIDEHFARRINEIITDSGRKAYLNIDTNEKRMKALFPNLRDAVSIEQYSGDNGSGLGSDMPYTADNKEIPQINADKESEIDTSVSEGGELLKNDNFVPYVSKGSCLKTVEFKSSKMAIGSAFKMGLHNLRLKKFRLLLIVLVTCLSFTLFGGINTLSAVETGRAIAESIEHDNIKVLSVSKNYLFAGDSSNVISGEMINTFKQKHKNCDFYTQYFLSLSISSFSSIKARAGGYYFEAFTGITEIDNMNNLGFHMLYGSSMPNTQRSVIISSYAAGALIKGGAFTDTQLNLKDIVGRVISVNGFETVICGIYETDYQPFTGLNNQLLIDAYNHVFQLFVSKDQGFINSYNNYSNMQNKAYIDLVLDGIKQPLFTVKPLVAKNSKALLNLLSSEITPVVSEDTQGREGIILIQSELDESLFTFINTFNASQNSYFNLGKNNIFPMSVDYNGGRNGFYPDNGNYITPSDVISDILFTLPSSKYYIEGYIITSTQYSGIALKEDTYGEYVANLTKTRQLLIRLSSDKNENMLLIRDLIENDMQANADFSFLFTMYMAMFLSFKSVIVGAVVFLSILAALLMYNFISTSIRLTKRNIGLMRALGVKKSHTFLVYVMEGLVIAVITFAVSVAVLLALIPILNSALSAKVGMYLPVMLVNPEVLIRMAVLSLAVSILATFVPWFKFAKITPVEAISNRKDA